MKYKWIKTDLQTNIEKVTGQKAKSMTVGILELETGEEGIEIEFEQDLLTTELTSIDDVLKTYHLERKI